MENQTKEQTATAQEDASKKKKKNVLFFGDSLTAAYQLDPAEGFTNILQNRIDSMGLNYKIINAGLSGETTAGGRERIDWVIRQPVDIFVLELGGNDGLRGIDPTSSYENLETILQKVKKKYPNVKIVLAGMEAPPNMGDKFTTEFRAMYPTLAEQYNTELIPFFLEGIAGNPTLNLPDGIHPNKEGQKILAETVWSTLYKLL